MVMAWRVMAAACALLVVSGCALGLVSSIWLLR
jgi:hypothetical protein